MLITGLPITGEKPKYPTTKESLNKFCQLKNML